MRSERPFGGQRVFPGGASFRSGEIFGAVLSSKPSLFRKYGETLLIWHPAVATVALFRRDGIHPIHTCSRRSP